MDQVSDHGKWREVTILRKYLNLLINWKWSERKRKRLLLKILMSVTQMLFTRRPGFYTLGLLWRNKNLCVHLIPKLKC